MEQDLFKTPELLPQEVKDILARYEEMGTSYDTCNNLIKELEPHGYTCDYGLDGIPYGLTTIKTNQTMKKPLTALQLWEFLTSLHEEGHDLENIKVLYRYDRDSDDDFVCAVEEDLYDMETNSNLETIMLLTNPEQL